MSKKKRLRRKQEKQTEAWAACLLSILSVFLLYSVLKTENLSPEAAAKQLLGQEMAAVRVSLLQLLLRCIQAFFLFVVVCVCVYFCFSVCICSAIMQLETEGHKASPHSTNSNPSILLQLLFYLQIFAHLHLFRQYTVPFYILYTYFGAWVNDFADL